jgi:hypothetical protein
MEPFTMWALKTAGSVLTKVLPELISGRIRAAHREEIAREVEIIVAEQRRRENHHALDQTAAEYLVRKVFDEIEIIAARDPDLQFGKQGIRLARRRPIVQAFSQRSVDKAVIQKLTNLQAVVDSRRRELDQGAPAPTHDPGEEPLQNLDASARSANLLGSTGGSSGNAGTPLTIGDHAGDKTITSEDEIKLTLTPPGDCASRHEGVAQNPPSGGEWVEVPLPEGRWSKRLSEMQQRVLLDHVIKDHDE